MLFTSFEFFVLVLITFFIYYQPRLSKFQVQTLIASNLVFYSFHLPYLVLLLLLSVLVNTLTSYYVIYGPASKRKVIAVSGVVINLLLLAFFKYSPLFSRTFFDLPSNIGEFLLTIPLPIGISFYTFQGISLVVDAFKSKDENAREIIPVSLNSHLKRTLFFISFFPHSVAGPIVKAHDFYPQIAVKFFKEIKWEYCFRNLVTGFFLKMVIADNLKDFTYWIEYPFFEKFSSLTLIFLLLGYSCQIFADFAGYSLIAIGLARLFGYDLGQNFNFPYISATFSEFWRRWHISLSTFLKEYLYIPLGGNRKGNVRTYIHLFITMLLGGLWHGAAWSYAVWGAFHGLALALERLLTNDRNQSKPGFAIQYLKRIIVFLFVTLAWLLFKLPDFSHVIKYIQSIGNNWSIQENSLYITYVILYSLPVFLYHLTYLNREKSFFSYKALKVTAYAAMIFFIVVNSGSAGTFIYFQF